MKPVGLYLHIPFCRHRCGYCDFATVAGLEHKIDSYLRCLQKEIKAHPKMSVDTVFIGGGTPSLLTPLQIEKLNEAIRSQFDLSPLTEATVEINPESASMDVLKAFKNMGINRLSFGLQATQNKLLAALDRLHNWEDFLKALKSARQVGFENINVDLIYGLPSQTMENWKESLKDVLLLQVEHISTYALKVEPETKFHQMGVTVDDDHQAEMYLFASRYLSDNNFHHYEISNFSKPNRESLHNLKYWKNEPTIGLGVSAAGYYQNQRLTNTRSLNEYLDSYQSGKAPPKESVQLNEANRIKENLMLHLRLAEGVELNVIESHLNKKIDIFLKKGLAHLQGGRFSLKPEGWLMSNQLFSHLV